MTVNVRLSPSDHPVTLQYCGGAARRPKGGLRARRGHFFFPASAASRPAISVPVYGDTDVEADETVLGARSARARRRLCGSPTTRYGCGRDPQRRLQGATAAVRTRSSPTASSSARRRSGRARCRCRRQARSRLAILHEVRGESSRPARTVEPRWISRRCVGRAYGGTVDDQRPGEAPSNPSRKRAS